MDIENPYAIKIGRDQQGDIVFPPDADDVSRLHAIAEWRDEIKSIVVRDNGSVNGTTALYGAVVASDGSIRVDVGQSIQLGEHVLDYEHLKKVIDQKKLMIDSRIKKEREEKQNIEKKARKVRYSVFGLFFVLFSGVSFLFFLERTGSDDREALLRAEIEEQLRNEIEDVKKQAMQAQVSIEESNAARKKAMELLRQEMISKSDFDDANMDGPFAIHDNGTVTDTRTGLTWRRCPIGMNLMPPCEGAFERFSWVQAGAASGYTVQDALVVINHEGGFAGYTDWRLPTDSELLTLANRDGGFESHKVFDGVPFLTYWTSTPWLKNGELNRYRVIDFQDGKMKWHEGAQRMPILVVRTSNLVGEK